MANAAKVVQMIAIAEAAAIAALEVIITTTLILQVQVPSAATSFAVLTVTVDAETAATLGVVAVELRGVGSGYTDAKSAEDR